MKKRNQALRKEALKRDNFTCQKCFLGDETGKNLEVHHKNPLFPDGKDKLDNLIALCIDCHSLAPNDSEEFNVYLQEECTGTMTNLIRAWKEVRGINPELINELNTK